MMTLEQQLQYYIDKWGWNESEVSDIRELLRRKWNIALDEAKAFTIDCGEVGDYISALKDE